MNSIIYNAVAANGKELLGITLEDIKNLYAQRLLNGDSLIFSSATNEWKMLKRMDFFNEISTTANRPNYQQPTPFSQPPFQTYGIGNETKIDYTPIESTGYQNYNTQQGYANQSNYQTPANYAPKNYSANQSFRPKNPNVSENRPGLRNASIFIVVNALFYLTFSIIGAFTPTESADTAAFNAGKGFGGVIFPLVIDLLLADRLWKAKDVESSRKWCLGRTYFGGFIWAVVLPIGFFINGQIFEAIVVFFISIFYVLSIILTLQGKESPSQTRLIFGNFSFGIHVLMAVGLLTLGTLGLIMQNLPKTKASEVEKYVIPGKEFVDPIHGAKVNLPESWKLLTASNPLFKVRDAKMIAINSDEKSAVVLEIVSVPANLDTKRQSPNQLLNFLCDYLTKQLKQDTQNESNGNNVVVELSRTDIFVGTHPGKKIIYDDFVKGKSVKRVIIITYDELNMYSLSGWCQTEIFEKSKADFEAIEKSFTIPDKIFSDYPQTATTKK